MLKGILMRVACFCLLIFIAGCNLLSGASGNITDDWATSYAVVISDDTYADTQWRQVADTLADKYDAAVITYPDSVDDALDSLRQRFPRYACFVATPAEASRQFILDVHRMTRRLDDDSYGDVIWGVITGYDADDALRIANYSQPLEVRRALSGTFNIGLEYFDQGLQFHESEKNVMFEKLPGSQPVKKQCETDTTLALATAMTDYQPDAFYTSGHATTKDWQIGYTYRNGSFRCKDGQLFGVDTAGKRHDINSQNAKIFLPMGNCLIGHIPGRDCMALALMSTGGVNQMFGYTVVTFYGYGGWGIRTYFMDQPCRFTLAQSQFCNNQALLHQIQTRFPDTADVYPDADEYNHNGNGIGKMAQKYNLRGGDKLGLIWDRDVVAFYGDPAWQATMAPGNLAWSQRFTENDGTYTLTITTKQKGTWTDRPVIHLLPHRIGKVELTKGKDLNPVITDNFILLPMQGEFDADQVFEIQFKQI